MVFFEHYDSFRILIRVSCKLEYKIVINGKNVKCK